MESKLKISRIFTFLIGFGFSIMIINLYMLGIAPKPNERRSSRRINSVLDTGATNLDLKINDGDEHQEKFELVEPIKVNEVPVNIPKPLELDGFQQNLIELKPGESNKAKSDKKNQPLIDYISQYMEVTYVIDDNQYRLKSHIILKNTGTTEITGRSWKLFIYHIGNPAVDESKIKKNTIVPCITFKHIDGYLYRISPKPCFNLAPSIQSNIYFVSPAPITHRSLFFPNWYVTANKADPRIMRSTMGEDLDFVRPLLGSKQYKRTLKDQLHPLSLDERYRANKVEDLGGAPTLVLPTPLSSQKNTSYQMRMDASWIIKPSQSILLSEAKFLSDILGLTVDIEERNSTEMSQTIVLDIGAVDISDSTNLEIAQAYSLEINPGKKQIRIVGRASIGVFYGIQSLLAILEDKLHTPLPMISITDAPRFGYRGFMLDVARNFFDKHVVMKIIDAMGRYKLNKLHFHLTDDEGWRIEIPGLPELTQIGGKRGYDTNETDALLTQLGSGPNPNGLGCGYYTIKDYREILAYAKTRHVEIIPEIDLPGHAHAARRAMELRYKRYKAMENPGKAREFLLTDFAETSNYYSNDQFRNNAVNPCLNSTFVFVWHIVESLINIHKPVYPLKTVHLGGNEVPKNATLGSPACDIFKTQYMMDNVLSFFMQNIALLAARSGVNVQAWEDVIYTDKVYMHNDIFKAVHDRGLDVTINAWQNIWSRNVSHRAYEMANDGTKVVLSPVTHLSFDHPHEVDPEEPGNPWATRYIDLKKVFNFMPDNFFHNLDYDRNMLGEHLSKATMCGIEMRCPILEKRQNIKGVEAQLPTQFIRYPSQLYQMLFPRLLAHAERAWHRSSWEVNWTGDRETEMMEQDWTVFVNNLGYREFSRLEHMGISYQLPLPGIRYNGKEIEVNTAIPGVPIQYSYDGGLTWTDFTPDKVVNDDFDILFSTCTQSKLQRSRVMHFMNAL